MIASPPLPGNLGRMLDKEGTGLPAPSMKAGVSVSMDAEPRRRPNGDRRASRIMSAIAMFVAARRPCWRPGGAMNRAVAILAAAPKEIRKAKGPQEREMVAWRLVKEEAKHFWQAQDRCWGPQT